MHILSRAYAYLVILLGGGMVVWSVTAFPAGEWTAYVPFALVAAALSALPVKIRGKSVFSAVYALTFGAHLLWGAAGYIVTAAFTGLLPSIFPKRQNLYRSAFNIASLALSAWISGYVGLRLEGLAEPFPLIGTYLLVPATFFVCNIAMVSLAVTLHTNQPLLTVAAQSAWLAPLFAALVPMGVALARAYALIGVLGVAVFVVPVALARYYFGLYMDKAREAEEHVVRLKESNQRLQGKIGQLSALHNTAIHLSGTLALDRKLQPIVQESARAGGFDTGIILLQERETLAYGAAWSAAGTPPHCPSEALIAAAATVLENGSPKLETVEGLDFLLSPLVFQGEAAGVLCLVTDGQPDADRMDLVTIFAAHAAAAIVSSRQYEEMRRMAVTDGLTGLYNQRQFLTLIQEAFARATVGRRPLSLITVDVDNLKQINDRLGHAAGDKAIRMVAQMVRAAVKANDPVFRTGGDEFAILLDGLDASQARSVADRLVRLVRQQVLTHGGKGISLSISAGVAAYPALAGSVQDLMDKADAAAYQAKESGRSRVNVWQEELAQKRAAGNGGVFISPHVWEVARSLASLVDARDPQTYGHASRVERYARALGMKLGLSPSELQELSAGALLHDIGKVAIPDGILNKPGPLTDEEWHVMKQHPSLGVQLLRQMGILEELVPLVYYHQERWDGKGYPTGLQGEEIPLGARIISICDAYEAMTSHRHYRRAMRPKEAIEELRRCSGTYFDPSIVDVFITEVLHSEEEVSLHA